MCIFCQPQLSDEVSLRHQQPMAHAIRQIDTQAEAVPEVLGCRTRHQDIRPCGETSSRQLT